MKKILTNSNATVFDSMGLARKVRGNERNMTTRLRERENRGRDEEETMKEENTKRKISLFLIFNYKIENLTCINC